MKRRETKSVWNDARLSPLVRSCARWLSFSRGLSRGARRQLAAADALAFVESLYGGKFKAAEGGAFPLDKVYRTTGGGLSISETRLSVSVHPRFDLRLLNIKGGRAVSEVFKETTTLLSHGGAGGRGQASHRTHDAFAFTSLTAHTWNVFQAGAGRALPPFGYVNIPGRRAPQPRQNESRRGDGATSLNAETSGLRLASLELSRHVVHAPRQEFVNVLLNTYLPAVVSREILTAITTGNLPGATPGRATAQGEAARRFTPAPELTRRRTTTWTYAEPAPRRAPGGAAGIRGEFHTVETLKEHVATRAARPPMLHVLSPASLLSSLSDTSLTLLAGGVGHTTYNLGVRAPALSLQQLRTHAAQPSTREASAPVQPPRLFAQTTPPRQASARDVLSSLNTLVRHVYRTVAGIERANHATVYTRPGLAAVLRRVVEHVPARQRVTSSAPAPGHEISFNLLGRPVEFVRPASAAAFTREARTHDAGTRVTSDGTRSLYSTRGAPGAATFLYATRLLRRPTGASAAITPSPAAPRPSAADAETGRVSRETRAARPEGMALELVRQRREQVLQLPAPGYVYTQPRRSQLEERQVITKASREEIVEVVRKEVRSLHAAAPAMPAPSRADLAGLADEVYSTLVRRLMVEKERLGRY